MKKLFLAGVITLAALTSCQNSESSITPEEQQKQTFQSKTTSREAGELPALTPEEEKAAIDETIQTLKNEREAELKGETTERKNLILCHTSYNSISGHACVYTTHGYLVEVTWEPDYDYSHFPVQTPPDPNIIYSGHVVPRCNC